MSNLAEIHKLYACHDRLLKHKAALFPICGRNGSTSTRHGGRYAACGAQVSLTWILQTAWSYACPGTPPPLPRRRVVVPLLPATSAPPPIRDLNPEFDIEDAPHVMLIQAIASIPVRELRRPVASLAQERDAITCAPDILFLGF